MSDAINAFSRFAAEYDRWFDSPQGTVIFRMELEAVRLLIKDFKKPFLEIGVGSGRFAKELEIEFGVDPSPKLLEMALKRGIKVKEAQGEKLPFDDARFGAVFILFTLCFVENPLMVLSEARRVLNKDGCLIVGFINKASAWGKLYAEKGKEGHPVYSYARFYSINEIIKIIKSSSMQVEAFSSALFQSPSDRPHMKRARKGLIPGAGFLCILSKK